MEFLTDYAMPMAMARPPSVRRAKRQWARMVSLRVMEEQGFLWQLPRGAVFAAVDRYLAREALRGRRDATVLEAIERTGMTARYHYVMRNPKRTSQQRLADLAALLAQLVDDHWRRFYSDTNAQPIGPESHPPLRCVHRPRGRSNRSAGRLQATSGPLPHARSRSTLPLLPSEVPQ
ncbi:hypothetical protein EPN42_03615 [bacterium]|nr:MAG: hypothetical protein EPN42_03615 [bacterium]